MATVYSLTSEVSRVLNTRASSCKLTVVTDDGRSHAMDIKNLELPDTKAFTVYKGRKVQSIECQLDWNEERVSVRVRADDPSTQVFTDRDYGMIKFLVERTRVTVTRHGGNVSLGQHGLKVPFEFSLRDPLHQRSMAKLADLF